MRNLLVLSLLTILSLSSALGQMGWVNIQLQPDQYSGETSWEIKTPDGETMATNPQYFSSTFQETVIGLPAGEYEFVIVDAFGDGICCSFGEGWFRLMNTCGLDTAVYNFDQPDMLIPFIVEPCAPPIFGCMDSFANNFNPWATLPGECAYPPQDCGEGETMVIATFTPDTYAGETSWDIMLFPDGEIIASGEDYSVAGVPVNEYVCITEGDSVKINVYDAFGDGMCGSCYGGVDGSLYVHNMCGDSIFYIGDTTQFDSFGTEPIIIEPCVPVVQEGCTDPWFTEYDPTAVIDDGSCETEVIYGCIDDNSINYNPDANTMAEEDNCLFTLTLTDGAGDGWFGSWLGVIQGDEHFGPFTMFAPDGYEKEIEIPLYSGEEVQVLFFTEGNAETTASQCGFYLEGPDSLVAEAGTNPWTDAIKKFPYRYKGVPHCGDFCIAITEGCTDEAACDFDPEANTDTGCTYPIEYYDCMNHCMNDADGDGVCDELEIVGCQDPTAFNYDATATDAGECIEVAFGCTDPTMFNYDADANTDNGSCVEFIYGCMDPLALNYDEDANTDNGNCIEAIAGCMDLDAYNFDPLANVADNDNCLYEAVGCINGVGAPYGDGYWLNDSCYAWVIQIDPFCCEVAWDGTCIDLYEYCNQGWPQGVPSESSREFAAYPNPTNSLLNIDAPYEAITSLYNAFGQIVVLDTREKTIDLTELPNGLYEVVVEYNGIIFKKKIVKL